MLGIATSGLGGPPKEEPEGYEIFQTSSNRKGNALAQQASGYNVTKNILI